MKLNAFLQFLSILFVWFNMAVSNCGFWVMGVANRRKIGSLVLVQVEALDFDWAHLLYWGGTQQVCHKPVYLLLSFGNSTMYFEIILAAFATQNDLLCCYSRKQHM